MPSYRLLLAACVMFLLLDVSQVSAQSTSGGLSVNSNNQRFLNCPVGAKSRSDCDAMGYVTRLIVFSVPGIIIAGLLLLFWPVYIIGKYCCDCCGGRYQSPNFCCPVEMEARYSKGDLLRPKVLAFLACAMAIAGFAWGYTGGSSLTSGLLEFTDGVSGIARNVNGQVQKMHDALIIQVYNASTDQMDTIDFFNAGGGAATFAEANKTVTKFDSLIQDNIGTVRSQIQQYVPLVFIIFIVPPIVMVLGMILGFLNLRRYVQMSIVWLLFLLGIILWITHALFCAGSMLTSDGCVELRGAAYGLQNTLSPLIGCSNAMFQPFRNSFNDQLQLQVTRVCEMIKPFCYDRTKNAQANLASYQMFVCPDPQPINCNSLSFGSLVVWTQTALYINTNYNTDPTSQNDGLICATAANQNRCTLDKCSVDCHNGVTLSQTGKIAKQVYSQFQATQKISVVIDTLASQYSNCDGLLTTMVAPFVKPCDTVVNALVFNRQASGLLGLGIIAGIFAFAWGAKRFLPLSEAEKPQPKEYEPETMTA
jgi:hypothetical protein